MKKVKVILFLAIIAAVLSPISTIILNNQAKSIGEEIGQEMGIAGGAAFGSFAGFTKGFDEGKIAGENEGLSAKDTTATLANEIKKVGGLRVLEMNIMLSDVLSVGAEDRPDSPTGYFALLTFEGTASYTVDLEQCVISEENDVIKITIPHPALRVTIDPLKTRKRAEDYASQYFDGSSLYGYEAFINSLKESTEDVKESLAGYDDLKEMADKRAISAVERLAGKVRLDDKTIVVELAAENDDETIEVVEEGVNT